MATKTIKKKHAASDSQKAAAKKLKKFMKDEGLSWEGVAYKANLTKQTIYNLIHCKHAVMPATAKRIETATGNLIPWHEWN